MSEKMQLPIECKKHHIVYDAYDTHCPECKKEYEAGDRILRRLLCQLCGELKGSTKMYCGGPVTYVCDDCRRILDKYDEFKKAYDEAWEQIKIERAREQQHSSRSTTE